MNQNDSILWDGPKFIIEIFWILIPKDPRLDLLQQAVGDQKLYHYIKTNLCFSWSLVPHVLVSVSPATFKLA